MAKDVIMPALGMAQETGVLLQWLKSEGDDVAKGEPLMEIETDKATVEVEANASGTLRNITANPGDEIPVGQVIAVILAAGEAAPEPADSSASAASAAPDSASKGSQPTSTEAQRSDVRTSPLAARIAAEHDVDLKQVEAKGDRIHKDDVLAYLEAQADGKPKSSVDDRALASPKARRLAQEHQLDLAEIAGSGPEGAVLAEDVSAAAEAKAKESAVIPEAAAAPSDGREALPVSRMWQVMAQRLTESWNTVPHFYLTAEANASQLIVWRERAQKRVAEKLTVTDLLVKVVAAALHKHPRLNARWENGSILMNDQINVGLAVAVDEGLLVPVIREADRLGLGEVAARRKELVTRGQAGKLSPAEMSEGTFTVSNLGMFGIDAFNAIVNPPQAAILAFGRIAERVVPIDGQPAVQPMMTMTLSCDHRVVDGARGAQFLQTLVQFIEDPLAVLD